MTSVPRVAASLDYRLVEIDAADPGGVARFHAETLGLPAQRDGDDGWVVEIARTTLRLRPAPPSTDPAYHLAFAVPENGIEAARDWLGERGVEPIPVDGDPVVAFPDWNAHALYFHDPAGSILELIARHELPNAADPATFGPHSLLRVDEVGLPTTHVPALVAALRTRLGALPYGGGSPDFQAVGEAHGLAIVVREGRGWYPTGRPAERHRVRLGLGGRTDATFELPGGPYTVTVTAPDRGGACG